MSRYERALFLCFSLSVRHDSDLTRRSADSTRRSYQEPEGARNLLSGSPPTGGGAGAIISSGFGEIGDYGSQFAML